MGKLLAALVALSMPTSVSTAHFAGKHKPWAVYTVEAPPKTKKELRKLVAVRQEQAAARNYILKVNPRVDGRRASKLAIAITDEAREHRFSWRIFAAVLAQESHFQPDLNTCHGRKDPNCDEGLGQINWPTWGESLGLDRHKLIHDDIYNIQTAAIIMGRLARAYAGLEENWWSRYHDYRDDHRFAYEVSVVMRL